MIRKSIRFAVLAISAAAITLGADSIAVNFESPTYVTGTIHNQDGWSSLGAAGFGCVAPYDHVVAPNVYGYGSFGLQSLRISNAVTSGCFGDQTFSKPVVNEAGETGAINTNAPPASTPMSGGTRQNAFTAQWDFASTVPTLLQPGLSVVASPDRGDGARMSWVQMTDTVGGLEVNFFDYRDLAPFGSTTTPAAGCGVEDNFFPTNVATGLDRTVPHTIRVEIQFSDGPRNDAVNVYVDGVLLHTGTSWEDYFRWCEGPGGPFDQGYAANESRTVDSILYRTGGAPAPATAGDGFVIDNLTVTSQTLVGPPTNKDQCKKGEWQTFNTPRTFKNQGDCIQFVNTGK